MRRVRHRSALVDVVTELQATSETNATPHRVLQAILEWDKHNRLTDDQHHPHHHHHHQLQQQQQQSLDDDDCNHNVAHSG